MKHTIGEDRLYKKVKALSDTQQIALLAMLMGAMTQTHAWPTFYMVVNELIHATEEGRGSEEIAELAEEGQVYSHTPAPWFDDGYRIYAPVTEEGRLLEPDEDKRNGRVIVEYKHVDFFNRKDAPLITAAPNMFNLLKAALWVIDGSFKVDKTINGVSTSHLKEHINEIITRIEGE